MKNLIIRKGIKESLVTALGIAILFVPMVHAQTSTDSKLSQVIGAGVISTSIRDDSGNVVPSPSFTMDGISASTSMQTATGTYGSNTQRITVDNPGGSADGSWTLAINATTPGTETWMSGSDSYSYNAATPADGQLTLNPSIGTITPVVGGLTGINKGVQATFSGVTPITLMSASTSAASIWNGYLTGVGVSQTIPASQELGTYTLDLTQTVTAQ